MSNRRNGGFIGPLSKPAISSAPGVWHLDDAQENLGASNWPGVGYSISYLVVGGGGGGGYNDAGGGGAGGLLSGSFTASYGSVYNITVGSGGSGSASSGSSATRGSAGGNSAISGNGISTITAVGGGGGAAFYSNSATTGGSGGGGSSTYAGGSGTSLQGNAGGNGAPYGNYYIGGGGGGAANVGATATTTPGVGGDGIASSITGTSVVYAGGGGGSGDTRLTTGSVVFNGSNYIVATGSTPFQFGTGNYTIEAWVNTSSISVQRVVSTGSGDILLINSGSNLYVNWFDGADNTTGTNYITLSAWNHIAVSRSGTSLKIFINGVTAATFTNSTNVNSGVTSYTIGTFGPSPGTQSFVGSISNVRMNKGTALYTANFTPSTSPLQAISGTSLLTCVGGAFFDGSSNNFPITTTGTPVNSVTSPFSANTANIAGASGGAGGGGTGGGSNGNATAGSVNLGGGGGGGAYLNNSAASGGSGVVIISMPSSVYSGNTTGSPTVTTSGSNTIVKFTGTGSYTA